MVDLANKNNPDFIQRLIAWCAHNWLLTLMVVIAATFWGYRSLMQAPLDAIPDLSDVQVIVFTEWPGRSPDLVEDQITYPLTTTLLAAPGVNFVMKARCRIPRRWRSRMSRKVRFDQTGARPP